MIFYSAVAQNTAYNEAVNLYKINKFSVRWPSWLWRQVKVYLNIFILVEQSAWVRIPLSSLEKYHALLCTEESFKLFFLLHYFAFVSPKSTRLTVIHLFLPQLFVRSITSHFDHTALLSVTERQCGKQVESAYLIPRVERLVRGVQSERMAPSTSLKLTGEVQGACGWIVGYAEDVDPGDSHVM